MMPMLQNLMMRGDTHTQKNPKYLPQPQQGKYNPHSKPNHLGVSRMSESQVASLPRRNKRGPSPSQDLDSLGITPPAKKKPIEVQIDVSRGNEISQSSEESGSESESEEATFSGMELPPLINQLKRILAEYPDGGQILKELIQNAEDAGATEIKLLYDQRNINQDVKKGKEYRKFFRGPALCVYNNAMFQKEDWRGITMIDMSVKESQPLKVGRFGLGFKSVFHLTEDNMNTRIASLAIFKTLCQSALYDYPCILSGDRLLLIDPQKRRDKVNATMLLRKLDKYKGMDVGAFFTALEGSFGLSRESIKAGSFKGTLFWFPLRNAVSKLSSNMYSEDKVMTLLESIKKENQSLIIFLKSLTSIKIEIRTLQKRMTYVIVEIKNSQEVGMKRQHFRESINNLRANGGESVECALKMEINTSILSDDGLRLETASVMWIVVNYFMGSDASSEFQRLIEDKELGLSPYVSVGAPVSKEAIEGHVFCFLPLPREDTSLTGLHVHINGFFALNQSRHHLKWSTEEQSGHEISDKNVLWNKYLISETLPLAYKSWFQEVLSLADTSPSDFNLIETIHRAIPVSDQVQGKWRELLSPLFRHLRDKKILYSRNLRVWVPASEALFPDDSCHVSDGCQQIVIKALTQMNINYVAIPHSLIETLSEYLKLDRERTRLTPLLFSHMLLNDRNQNYKSLSAKEKMAVIEFLLHKNDTAYLKGLELLPLASGRWTDFKSSMSEKVYLCDPREAQLFPGMEDKMLLQRSEIEREVFIHFDKISKTGTFQLKQIEDQSELEAMFQGALNKQMPNDLLITERKTSKCTFIWLQNAWTYLLSRAKVSTCENVPLIPLLTDGDWSIPEIKLVKATNKLVIKEHNNHRLQDEVVNCLRALSFDVLPSLPDWLPFKDIKSYVYLPKPESVVEILSNIQQHCSNQEQQEIVTKFNNMHKSCRKKFMEYICDAVNYQTPCISLLKQLQMFESFQSSNGNCNMLSINDNRQFVVIDTFPVSLPRTCIDGSGNTILILENLGAEQLNYSDIVILTLTHIRKGKYNEKDILIFMKFLVENFNSIKDSCSDENKRLLIQNASNISFLKSRDGLKKPSEMFNVKDQILLDLFKDEFVFPEDKLTDDNVQILLILGMKTPKHLTSKDIVSSARLLDVWSRNNTHNEDALVKSKALIEILSTCPELLEMMYDDSNVKEILSSLEIIEPKKERIATFPIWLPWYSHSSLLYRPSEVKGITLANLIGSVMPVVECSSEKVAAAFLWKSAIPTHLIFKQLQITQANYEAKFRPYLLDYLQQLYRWLNVHVLDGNEWENIQLIWVDEKFCTPNEVITYKQDNDLNLKPLFYNVPAEFEEFSDLFEKLGCYRHQGIDVLLETLSRIQTRKNNSDYLRQTVSILSRLAEVTDKIDIEKRKDILIPIHSENKGGVIFKRLEDCTYTEDPDDSFSDDEEEEEKDVIYFVHKSVSADIAQKLGVRSLLRRHLIDTEDIIVEECGQEEPLTTRLKTLIEEGYVDGLSVPKELLQNADDAGATCLKLLYDERENLDAMDSLLNQGMKTCHGPSLWVYNDAKFSDEDFVNIRKLNAATKRQNMQTIGKFGLGFCSVYNLTDVPSIVSGSNIVIFDPHKSHLKDSLSGNSPGLKIDFSKKGNIKLLKRNKDQFKPYNGIFGCDLSSKTPYFEGTLFRLPLRTSEESKVSEIKGEPYSQRDISELLTLFIRNAINLLIFMQNIKTIEVYHLSSSAKTADKQELLFVVGSNSQQHNERIEHKNVLSQFISNQYAISEIQQLHISLEVFKTIENIKPKLQIEPAKSQSCWLLSWATGTRRIKTLLQDPHFNSNLPLAAVAVPLHDYNSGPKHLSEIGLGSFKTGRFYCFLPIPYDIQLPWHLHGCFEVTSDRRQLKVVTEEDKPTNRESWNECLLEDAGVNAFIQVLEYFTQPSLGFNYTFHKLWPIQTPDVMSPFVKSFFRRIVLEDINIFETATGWFSFKKIVFLDPDIKEDQSIGEIAYTMLQYFQIRPNKVLTDLPSNVIEAIRVNNEMEAKEFIDSKVVRGEEMLNLFFQNIADSFWNSRMIERNKMVKYALTTNYETVHKLIKCTRCIQSITTFDLKRPDELVHPDSPVSAMFCVADGRFPIYELREKSTLEALVQHGMINRYLPADMLLERIQSIETLANQCTICANVRIKSVIEYLNSGNIIDQYDDCNFDAVRDAIWLPVLQKPSCWRFTWFAEKQKNMKIFPGASCLIHSKVRDALVLGETSKIYGSKDKDYVASVSNIIDETQLGTVKTLVWQKIGIGNIASQQGFEDIVHQLVILAEEYDPTCKLTYSSYSRIYRQAVKILYNGIKEHEERKLVLQQLSDKHFILINQQKLVPPCRVAFQVQQPCYPFLCKLPDQDKQFSEFYKVIGVTESFSIETIITVLIEKSHTKQNLKKDDVDEVIQILHNLVEFLEKNNKTYMDYKEYQAVIVGPDNTGCLYPTHELALDDQSFNSSVQMKIIHDAFQRDIAKKLGVKSKKLKCMEQISFGIPWGQKEKLETRIQGLLEDYPCDDSILKELLQNADDANAKELHFIMDFRHHSTETIVGKGNLQKPSLCVYNDGYFTESDLLGLTNLGVGSKKKDASKTGQFGIGFNAVYHITDTPSVLTKGPGLGEGVLCILDPLCCDIPVDQSNPGLRFSRKQVQENFPNSLSGFLEKNNFFHSGKGTMFRFPLRRKASSLSLNTLTDDQLHSMLKSFSKNILDILLFVKSVERIHISSIRDEKLTHEYSLVLEISDIDRSKRDHFFSEIKEVCKRNDENLFGNLQAGQKDVSYAVNVSDSNKFKAKWFIYQTFGCLDGKIINERIKEAFDDKLLSHLPFGGVAVPYSDIGQPLNEPKTKEALVKSGNIMSDGSSYRRPLNIGVSRELQQLDALQYIRNKGKLFAFLPLPVKTGFKIHINANFALDHSRRDVWKEGYKLEWNTFLGENMIVVSWINSLKHLQELISSANTSQEVMCSQVMEMIQEYHSLFPVIDNLLHDFSKNLVKQFYEKVYKENIALFPIVTNESNQDVSIKWVSLKASGKMFGAVFKEDDKAEYDLHMVLKRLGMELIETPKQIYITLQYLEYHDIQLLNPNFVIIFLHSFQNEELGTCCIRSMDIAIENTVYSNAENLKCIVEYIFSQLDVSSNVENLPILLTADRKIHTMRKGSGIIHSRFYDLLPSSNSVFLHPDFICLFSKKDFIETQFFKSLDVDSFINMLQDEAIDEFRRGTQVNWDKTDQSNLITPAWIKQFFIFIDCSPLVDAHISLTTVFQNWSFLPSKYFNKHTSSWENKLLPFSMAYVLYHNNSDYFECRVHEIVSNLELPTLDETLFDTDSCKQKVYDIIANTRSPLRLLKCLHHHTQIIEESSLSTCDAEILLSYFDRHLSELTESGCKQYLKELPLHLSHEGKLLKIDTSDILILPAGIPNEGLEVWASHLNKIVLRKNNSLNRLYNEIGLSGSNKTDFYARFLVPTINSLPQQHWITHFKVMRTLLNQNTLSICLLSKLQNLPLFRVGNEMKRACELFWHENKVFKLMLDDEKFPPVEYRSAEWAHFCRSLNMQFEVTEQLLIEFAKMIEEAGQNNVSAKTREQSNTLFNHFLSRQSTNWNKECLINLKSIRFICPYEVEETLREIHSQPVSCNRLIAFSQSISFDKRLLCWSSMDMIRDLPIEKHTRDTLGIYTDPPVDKVTLHCQNISISLQKKLEENKVTDILVKEIFENIYSYFSIKTKADIDSVSIRLEKFPFVYLPLHNILVKAKAVVIDMPQQSEIKPFLFKAPTYYGKYFDLFAKMGSKQEFVLSHCVYVLQELKLKVGDNIMMAEEFHLVKKVVKSIEDIKKKCKRIETIEGILYLPNRQRVLKNSKCLTISNNLYYERLLQNRAEIDFSLDFSSFEIFIDQVIFFRKLPDSVRPTILTDVVTQNLSVEGLQIVENMKAIELQEFLHSEQFVQGFLRLVKSNIGIEFDNQIHVPDITKRIRSIQVVCAKNLAVILLYKGQMVTGTEKQKHYFVKREENPDHFKFYVSENEINKSSNGIVQLNRGLVTLLKMCTGYEVNWTFFSEIILKFENPETIHEVLDEMHVEALHIVGRQINIIFPHPGIRVEEHFLPFLEEAIIPFKSEEYKFVAMELEDPVLQDDYTGETGDSNTSVYIYVHIMKEKNITPLRSDLNRVYIVKTGNVQMSYEEVPIYRLYRFVRKQNDNAEMVEYDAEPTVAVAFDTTCQRIRDMLQEAWSFVEKERKRIIRRLLLKWHPDKNKGNERYCRDIFLYIKSVILLLEKGEQVSSIINRRSFRSSSNMSESAYDNLVRNVTRRAKVYARAYYENVDDYNRNYQSGRYSHFSYRPAPRPDISEARRWMRQAKMDYRAAYAFSTTTQDTEGHNWICYTCHQACEKALRAAHFSKDANQVPGRTHALYALARNFGAELRNQISEIESRLQNHNRMRYPDSVSRPQIPSDLYSEDDAKFALEKTKNLIVTVENEFELS